MGVYIRRPGVYYGQCSEICGANHPFMTIVVEGVGMERYVDWVRGNMGGLLENNECLACASEEVRAPIV